MRTESKEQEEDEERGVMKLSVGESWEVGEEKKVLNLKWIPENQSVSGDDFWFRKVSKPTPGQRKATECVYCVGQQKHSAALCQPESDEGAFASLMESFLVCNSSLVLFSSYLFVFQLQLELKVQNGI